MAEISTVVSAAAADAESTEFSGPSVFETRYAEIMGETKTHILPSY